MANVVQSIERGNVTPDVVGLNPTVRPKKLNGLNGGMVTQLVATQKIRVRFLVGTPSTPRERRLTGNQCPRKARLRVRFSPLPLDTQGELVWSFQRQTENL